MLLDNCDSKKVWDQLSVQLGRRNKYTTDTMREFLEKKSVLARRLKLDDELHLHQLADMFGPAVLPYLQASQPAPPKHETQEEKIKIPENDAELNDVREMDREDATKCDKSAAAAEEVEIPEVDAVQDATVTDEESVQSNATPKPTKRLAAAEEEDEEENHNNSKYDKLEAKIPANDVDAEVNVGRDKILIDEEVKHRTDPEGDEILKKVEEEIVGDETLDSVTEGKNLESLDHAVSVVLGDLNTHEGKQRPREEVHAQSGTQKVSKQDAPRREGESDVLFNRPSYHSTNTKADALRMTDVENGEARERTRSPPGDKSARNFANDSGRKFNNFHAQRVNHRQEFRRLLSRG
ncbi:hypothetical protein FQA39_LY05811 [Lamprigera yunnana]|nr:hypothetical protein FQA39_LY05811 [Lamprigera yunnana]